MCNRIVLIDRGRVVLYGAVDQIKREFSTNAVLVHGKADFRSLPGVLRGAAGEQPLAAVPGAGRRRRRRLPCAGRPGWRVKIERFELAEPSLDDIFVSVVSGDPGAREGGEGASWLWRPTGRATRPSLRRRRPMGNVWKVCGRRVQPAGPQAILPPLADRHAVLHRRDRRDRRLHRNAQGRCPAAGLRRPGRSDAGLLSQPAMRPTGPRRFWRPLRTRMPPEAPCEAGTIQGYYLIPADYLTSTQRHAVSPGASRRRAKRVTAFQAFLTAHLLSERTGRVAEGAPGRCGLNYRSVADAREMPRLRGSSFR